MTRPINHTFSPNPFPFTSNEQPTQPQPRPTQHGPRIWITSRITSQHPQPSPPPSKSTTNQPLENERQSSSTNARAPTSSHRTKYATSSFQDRGQPHWTQPISPKNRTSSLVTPTEIATNRYQFSSPTPRSATPYSTSSKQIQHCSLTTSKKIAGSAPNSPRQRRQPSPSKASSNRTTPRNPTSLYPYQPLSPSTGPQTSPRVSSRTTCTSSSARPTER